MTSIERRDSSRTNQTQAFHGSHLRHPRRCERHPDLVRHHGELCRRAKGFGSGAFGFAEAAGFEAKAGRSLLLPGTNGQGALGGVLFGLEGPDEAPRSVSARPAGAAFAGGHLPLRQRAARCAACRACHRARPLSLHPLSQGRGARDKTRSAAKPRPRRPCPHRRSDDAGARSHQYAGKRHGAGAARAGRAQARLAPLRHHQRRSRRGAAGRGTFR